MDRQKRFIIGLFAVAIGLLFCYYPLYTLLGLLGLGVLFIQRPSTRQPVVVLQESNDITEQTSHANLQPIILKDLFNPKSEQKPLTSDTRDCVHESETITEQAMFSNLQPKISKDLLTSKSEQQSSYSNIQNSFHAPKTLSEDAMHAIPYHIISKGEQQPSYSDTQDFIHESKTVTEHARYSNPQPIISKDLLISIGEKQSYFSNTQEETVQRRQNVPGTNTTEYGINTEHFYQQAQCATNYQMKKNASTKLPADGLDVIAIDKEGFILESNTITEQTSHANTQPIILKDLITSKSEGQSSCGDTKGFILESYTITEQTSHANTQPIFFKDLITSKAEEQSSCGDTKEIIYDTMTKLARHSNPQPKIVKIY